MYYTEVTPTTGILLISAHILKPFRILRSFKKWNKWMDIHPEDETSYTIQFKEAFLKYVENEYCAKHWRLPINKLRSLLSSNVVPSATASQSYQLSFDSYYMCSDNGEYLPPNNVAEITPRWIDYTARLLISARLYLNSPPEACKNWGQLFPNCNVYYSNPVRICSKFWILDITDW
jgi:hypothetical protein